MNTNTNINTMTIKEFRSLPDREWNKDIGQFDSFVILPAQISFFSFFSKLNYKCYQFLKKILFFIFPTTTKILTEYRMDGMHDSGYRLLDFVACKNDKPICLLSGCSDVLHLNGISKYGYKWLEIYKTCPEMIEPVAWTIDCLPTS